MASNKSKTPGPIQVVVVLMLSVLAFYFGNRFGQVFDFNTMEITDGALATVNSIVAAPAAISTASVVNCLISNTNGDKQSGGDPFWENSERLLYTALIALLRDWFPPEDYSLDGLLTLLSMAEAKENDENFKSPLDMIFDEIETGKVYERNPFYQGPSTSSSYADAESDRMAISENTTDEFTWQSSLMERNNDGLSPAREGGLTSDQDFALANYKMFKVAAGKTLKSIIISCNVRMAPMRIEQVRELLKYDEMNLDEMGDPGQRTAVFAIMSDTDKRHAACPARPVYMLPRPPAGPRSSRRPSRATRRSTSIGLGAATTASLAHGRSGYRLKRLKEGQIEFHLPLFFTMSFQT